LWTVQLIFKQKSRCFPHIAHITVWPHSLGVETKCTTGLNDLENDKDDVIYKNK